MLLALLEHVLALRGRHHTHHSAKRVQHPQAALGASERTRAQNSKKQHCQNSPPGACSSRSTSDPCSKHTPLLHGVTLQLVRGHQLLTVGLRGSKQGSRAVLPAVPAPGWLWRLGESRKKFCSPVAAHCFPVKPCNSRAQGGEGWLK